MPAPLEFNLVVWCQHQIADMEKDLELLESGILHTQERRNSEPWVDTTDRDKEDARQQITYLKRFVQQLENSPLLRAS